MEEPKRLTQMQLREFLSASRGEGFEVLIKFLALTGCLLGEALALRWTEVDIERQIARIIRSVRLKKEAAPEIRFGRRSNDLPTNLLSSMMMLTSYTQQRELVFCTPVR